MPTSTSAKAISTAPTSTPTPAAKRLTKAIATHKRLVWRIEFTYTMRYNKAHHSLHTIYTELQTLTRGPPVGVPDSRIALRERFLGYAETHRMEMRIASDSVRRTRESLAKLKKKIVELEKQVAAEKRGVLVHAKGTEMGA